jgi:protease I
MRALVVSADRFEDSELSEPLQQLQARGVEVDIAAPQQGPITGKHGHRVSAGLALSAVRAEDYELLLLPGGEAPARLRKIPAAVAIARHFLQADKPVAAICHGPQLLIATGLMAGRTATCYRAVRHELEAAGGNYLDREVIVDDNLVTSRKPSDIPSFVRAIFQITGLLR